MQKSSGGLNISRNFGLSSFVPSISKTLRDLTTFCVTNGPFSAYNDHLGQHVRFPQCPHLTFSSPHSASEYFEALAKLQKLQHVLEAAGRQADYAAERSRLPKIPDPCERVWQFKSSLEPSNVKPVVNLPTSSYEQRRGPDPDSAVESVSQDTRKALVFQPSSRSSTSQFPPQTLFTESTPHAQQIQAQPRVVLPVPGVHSWPYNSQLTPGSNLQPSRPSLPLSKQTSTRPGNHTALDIYHDISSPSSSSFDETLAQPQSSYDSCSLPSSYTATVFPQTLAKKDKRVLGVSLTASIDEYVPVYCSGTPPRGRTP